MNITEDEMQVSSSFSQYGAVLDNWVCLQYFKHYILNTLFQEGIT